jgi:phosphatidylglycerol lysyltransferase
MPSRPTRGRLRLLLTLFLFAAALWLLHTLLKEYRYADIARALSLVRPSTLALSAAATVLGYLALVGHDYVAFRIVGHPLPLRRMLLPSFVSFAVSNSAPASVLTAGGVRYRMYARLGLSPGQAAGIAGVNVVTYVLGLLALAGLSLLVRPDTPLGAPAWLAVSGRTLGALLVLVVAAYLAATFAHRRALRIFGRELRLPATRLALAQLGLSAADWLLSSGALYVLLADVWRLPYLVFLTRFLVAAVVTLIAPVPGGLGVFEALVLYLTSSGAPAARVLAALLVYRVVYYLLPLFTAGGVALVWAARRPVPAQPVA